MSHGPPAKTGRKNSQGNEEDYENQMPIPPDGGWGWVVAFASFAIHIMSKF